MFAFRLSSIFTVTSSATGTGSSCFTFLPLRPFLDAGAEAGVFGFSTLTSQTSLSFLWSKSSTKLSKEMLLKEPFSLIF